MLKFTAGLITGSLLFSGAYAAVSPFWGGQSPGVTGPWLGDTTFNISSLWSAHTRMAGMGYTAGLSVSQTTGQANCTQLNADAMQQISTSAAAGYVCLPTAQPGKEIFIGNATGQTINIYSSNTPFTAGTPDTINGTAGSTAYTGLTTGKNADCFAAAGGAWYCSSGS